MQVSDSCPPASLLIFECQADQASDQASDQPWTPSRSSSSLLWKTTTSTRWCGRCSRCSPLESPCRSRRHGTASRAPPAWMQPPPPPALLVVSAAAAFYLRPLCSKRCWACCKRSQKRRRPRYRRYAGARMRHQGAPDCFFPHSTDSRCDHLPDLPTHPPNPLACLTPLSSPAQVQRGRDCGRDARAGRDAARRRGAAPPAA